MITAAQQNYRENRARISDSRYRLVVGESGNEQGHIIYTFAGSEQGARRALRREIAKYKGDGWGRLEYLLTNGVWQRMEAK